LSAREGNSDILDGRDDVIERDRTILPDQRPLHGERQSASVLIGSAAKVAERYPYIRPWLDAPIGNA